MSSIKVLSNTQRIIVDSDQSVSIINAGPPGPRGLPGDSGTGGDEPTFARSFQIGDPIDWGDPDLTHNPLVLFYSKETENTGFISGLHSAIELYPTADSVRGGCGVEGTSEVYGDFDLNDVLLGVAARATNSSTKVASDLRGVASTVGTFDGTTTSAIGIDSQNQVWNPDGVITKSIGLHVGLYNQGTVVDAVGILIEDLEDSGDGVFTNPSIPIQSLGLRKSFFAGPLDIAGPSVLRRRVGDLPQTSMLEFRMVDDKLGMNLGVVWGKYPTISMYAINDGGYASGSVDMHYRNDSGVSTNLFSYGYELPNTADLDTRNFYIYDQVSHQNVLMITPDKTTVYQTFIVPERFLLNAELFISEYEDDVLQIGSPPDGYDFGAGIQHNNGVVSSFNRATGTSGYRVNIKAESWLDPTSDGTQGIYPFLGIGHMKGPFDLNADYVDGGDFIALHEGSGKIWSSYGVRAQAYNNSSGSYDFMAGLHAMAHNYGTGGGTIGSMSGISVSLGDFGLVTITDLYGIKIEEFIDTGASTIDNAYGIYIGDLFLGEDSDASYNNPPYAIYTEGPAKSRFGGPIEILGSSVTPNLVMQAASGSFIDQTQWKDGDGNIVAQMFFNGALRVPYMTVINGMYTKYIADVDGAGPYFELLSDKTTLYQQNGTEIVLFDGTGDCSFAESVSVGGLVVDASAILSANSTTKGFLPPRMTTMQRDAIVSPANGLVIFNTDTSQLEVFV